ncbi:MAG: glutathione S-transferase N-terminal domain-containing protein [Pseudomonadota bacterium]
MPELHLYGVVVSAFVAKVRIVLDHKGLAYEEASPPGGYGSAAYRALVPAGSVPGLIVDGAPLHDSNAIVEYLDEIAPSPPLLPRDAYDRARARALLGFHDTRLEAAARTLFPVIKSDWRSAPTAAAAAADAAAADAAAADAGVAAVGTALERLEELIDPAPFVFGAAPSLADLAYPVTLQMAEMLSAELDRPLTLTPKVEAWRAATAALPAVARSLDLTRDAMERWMAGFR